MNRPHFRRRPRVAPDSVQGKRPDRADGLTNVQILGRDRYAQCDETCTADCGACKGRRFGPYAIPHLTRYDAEWPDVLAAEAPGGDLAAMAAPADWPAFSGWGEYDIEREPVAVTIRADVSRFHEAMAQAQAATAAAAKPHGRHRQTDPLDLILADLRDLDGL